MAAAVASTDIDSFIREQKAKLATERTALNESEGPQPTRRHWDTQAGRQAPIAVQEGRPQTQESGLPLGNNQSRQKQQELARQRQQEYNQLLKQSAKGPRVPARDERDDEEISNPSIIPFNRAEEDKARRRRLEEERHREYQQVKAKLEENHRHGRAEASSRSQPPVNDRQPQRRADKGSLLEQTDEYKAKLPGMNESDLAKIEKEKQRNEEYNQYLRENEGRRTRASDLGGDKDCYATLPGMRDSHSAKVRKEQERNREYNDFLASRSSQRTDGGRPPPAPRKGWGTPTYEDILEKKREEERNYRRANDPSYVQPLEQDDRLRQASRQSDTKTDIPARVGSAELLREYREVLSRLQDYGFPGKPRQRIESPRNPSPPRNVSPPQPSRARDVPREKPSDYYATLPIGQSSDSALRRKKEQYRHDLQRQMREVQEGKKREKQAELNIVYSGERALDLNVDYSGQVDPEERRGPALNQNANSSSRRPPPAPSRRSQPTTPRHDDRLDKFDQLSSRPPAITPSGAGLLDNPFSMARGAGGGLLDTGFSSLLEQPGRSSNLAPPPGLQYQPASFITQGGGGLGHTSVEDAYNFYATHNPLDADGARRGEGGGGGYGGGAPPRQVPEDQPVYSSRDEGRGGGGGPRERGGGGGGGRSNRVRFQDDNAAKRALMDFPSDDDKKREAQRKAQTYQEELARQIEEKKRKKLMEKEEKDRYDRKLEAEAENYNPYGRGGGGAPSRDAYGNIVTDLRSMKRDADNPDSSRRAQPPPPQQQFQLQLSPRSQGPRDDKFGPPPVQTTVEGEQTHARGGHGIFGLPKTSEEKHASEKYKEDLRRQIEEQKMEQLKKKQEEKEEEEREERRLEEQRQRMQREYEEEQRKIKAKEDEARQKNEELLRQAEERKKEAQRKRKEEEEKAMEEERRIKEAEINARLANVERGKSPVIPTLRHKTQDSDGAARDSSPPVPAARKRTVDDDPVPSTSKGDSAPPSRAASADVLNQLAVMRKQLQNERQRVEDLLQTDKKAPEVFDPRLVQRPPPAAVSKPEVDVFETARQGRGVAVRRTPAEKANLEAMEDFNALRHKEDSDSRKEFRQLFPDQPGSADALEAQQAALIHRQEQQLRAMRDRRERGEAALTPKPSFPLSSPRGQNRASQPLSSNSAFVDVDGLNYFPDDFDDMASNRRNDSARARRRERRDSNSRLDSNPRGVSRVGADPFGSSTSLNVDRLARKNEDRLKRLRELQGDDLSLYDPEDVLDRFMSKQSQHRPPSGQTLQDDSWLVTGPASKIGY